MRRKQRLFGLCLMLVSAGYSAWTWYTAMTRGYYYRNAAVMMPAFFVMGLGIVLFPGYREERLARGEDLSRLSGYALITLRWRVILILSLLVGFANWALLAAQRFN